MHALAWLLSLPLLLPAGASAAEPLQEILGAWGFSVPGLEGFEVEQRSETARLQNILARNGETVLRIQRETGKTGEDARRAMERRDVELETIYGGARNAYSSGLLKRVSCAKRFRHLKQTAEGQVHFSAYASARNVIGACHEADAKFHVVISMIACADSLVTLERYMPGGVVPEKQRLAALSEAKTSKCRAQK